MNEPLTTTPDPTPIDDEADLRSDLATLGLTVDDLGKEEPPRRPRPPTEAGEWVELPPGTTIDIMAMLNDV